MSELPEDVSTNKSFSFMMKDQVLSESMKYALKHSLA